MSVDLVLAIQETFAPLDSFLSFVSGATNPSSVLHYLVPVMHISIFVPESSSVSIFCSPRNLPLCLSFALALALVVAMALYNVKPFLLYCGERKNYGVSIGMEGWRPNQRK